MNKIMPNNEKIIRFRTCVWDSCPPEIIYKIFNYLDENTLLNCMVVNKRWYCIVSTMARLTGWRNILVYGLPDKGFNFIKKSLLDWRDININRCLWQYVNSAKACFIYNYSIHNITRVNIYRGNIIVVCPPKVIYFDIETYHVKRTIECPCYNFDENDYMIAASSLDNFELALCHKPYPNSEWQEEYTKKFKVHLYKVTHTDCYLVSPNKSLFYVTWVDDAWYQKFLALYYGHGKISDLTVYHDKVYAVLDWGRILEADKYGMRFILGFVYHIYDIPISNVTMYNISGAVVEETRKVLKLRRQGLDHWVLKCPNLTCVLVHGEILLLGYKSGKVQIFIPRNMKKRRPKPEFSFNVQKFAKPPLKDPAVLSLDVSEAKGSHVLYVATCSNLLQIMLEYPTSLRSFMQEAC